MCIIQWIIEYKDILATFFTVVIIVIAILPIYQNKNHKRNLAKSLRARIHIELIELNVSLIDKLADIEKFPEKPPIRKFKPTDKQLYTHLEKLFENVDYLNSDEFELFDDLMCGLRIYTFPYLKKGIDMKGINKIKPIVERLLALLTKNLGNYRMERQGIH